MSPLVLFVCRTYTQHKVSSLNAGDALSTQNEPEEMTKKEKKSEALNIRGRFEVGSVVGRAFPSTCGPGCPFHPLFAFESGVLGWRRVTCIDYDPGLLPNHCTDSEGDSGG